MIEETLAKVFSCEFCEIFKNTLFTEYFRWLLLIWPELKNDSFTISTAFQNSKIKMQKVFDNKDKLLLIFSR